MANPVIDYRSFPNRNILCVDMKSFYASCAAIVKGLDPLTSHIAVVADLNRPGSVVLAASPAMKKDFGVRTGSRLFEIPEDPRIHLVSAQMNMYLQVSVELTRLFHRYVPKEAIHTYSVDESFLDVTGTEKLWGSAEAVAHHIQQEMLETFHLPCAIGIGPNMLLAKLCLDLEAKKKGIATWTYADVPTKLWPVAPLREMWGIGSQLEKRLNRLGITNVGQLAQFSLKQLEKLFGVMGNQLYYHANGVDLSELGAPIMQGQISFGKSQILMRDYHNPEEVRYVVLEMCEEVAKRARSHKKAGRTIHFGLSYSKGEGGGGFYRSKSVEVPTNITTEIYDVCMQLMDTFYRQQTVRKVTIALSNITEDEGMQLSLFEPNRDKKRELGYVMDHIRHKYGSDALLRAVSYTEAGTALHRSKLVGGHYAE
ncbi:UV-damage repair protein uvrX [Pontibacillus litoralis JSM 072002]|uniref:UV-damage repair protein uvrX n=2 Tax=Pontibacillus TaxID=289201 RepID=A0A0A5G1V5_9BACI|nr:UV-damage repair protein uvrX [Pontibacillus litoralis JSM 072002]